MKFGDYLRQKRQDRGWTQPEAALKGEIEQSYLSKIETGKAIPSEEVFDRLAEIYDLEASEFMSLLYPSELDRMREISAVRAVGLRNAKRQQAATQRWLYLGLSMFVLGGGLLGLTQVDSGQEIQLFTYQSPGVIGPEESLNLFDDVFDAASSDGEADDSRLQAQLSLQARIDLQTRSVPDYQGPSYIEEVEGGKRIWNLVGGETRSEPPRFRWAWVPGLALLLGGLACGFISWRSHPSNQAKSD